MGRAASPIRWMLAGATVALAFSAGAGKPGRGCPEGQHAMWFESYGGNSFACFRPCHFGSECGPKSWCNGRPATPDAGFGTMLMAHAPTGACLPDMSDYFMQPDGGPPLAGPKSRAAAIKAAR